MSDGVRKAAETGRERVEAARELAGARVDAAKTAAGELQARVKPRLRGVIHEYAFPVSLLAGFLLVLFVGQTAVGRISLGIYALSLSALLAPARSITGSTGGERGRDAGCAGSTTR